MKNLTRFGNTRAYKMLTQITRIFSLTLALILGVILPGTIIFDKQINAILPSAMPTAKAAITPPISLTALGVSYTQNFDTLASTGTSSTTPDGWGLSETGTNANTSYTGGTGSSATGDTYSFGSTGSSDLAFGGLQSGSLIPTIGACFQNNAGSLISTLTISYRGEQWRLGATGRADRLDFQYSTDATSLTSGTWTDFNSLDFSSPVTTGSTGALNGNTNSVTVTSSVTPLAIANGGTFCIRWNDFNASGADDGLAVDDFSLTPESATASVATIGGRVTTAAGAGIPNSKVTLTGQSLSQPRYAFTNPFGYYSFTDVAVGEDYVLTVQAKRYIFNTQSQLVNAGGDMTEVNFIAQPR